GACSLIKKPLDNPYRILLLLSIGVVINGKLNPRKNITIALLNTTIKKDNEIQINILLRKYFLLPILGKVYCKTPCLISRAIKSVTNRFTIVDSANEIEVWFVLTVHI